MENEDLLVKVSGAIDQFWDTVLAYDGGDSGERAPDISATAASIVAMIEQDVARRLLSDDVIETMTDGLDRLTNETRNDVRRALYAAGIEP